MLKIAFDVGGVLSKYPALKELLQWMAALKRYWADTYMAPSVEVYVISDMHPKEKIAAMLRGNNIFLDENFVFSADYATHGENCKKILCEQLGVDIFVDDFIGYLAEGDFIRLLVMPNPRRSYYHEEWKTDGAEGDFGRRTAK